MIPKKWIHDLQDVVSEMSGIGESMAELDSLPAWLQKRLQTAIIIADSLKNEIHKEWLNEQALTDSPGRCPSSPP